MVSRLFLSFFLIPLGLQNPNNMPAEERAKLEVQNSALVAMLQHAPKLPLEQAPIPVIAPQHEGWVLGMVSWVAAVQRFGSQGQYLGEWSQYGKTFGLKLVKDALWLSSIPRGPNGAPGWLIKVDRATGTLLGHVDAMGNHGMDVTPAGDLLQAPGPNQIPQRYHSTR